MYSLPATPRSPTAPFIVGCVLLALAPLPFGSVQPAAAMLWIAATGLALAMLVLAGGPSVAWPKGWAPALFCILLAALIFQLLPLGGLFPGADWAGFGSISRSPAATGLMILRFAGYGAFLVLVRTLAVSSRRALTLLYFLLAIVTAYAGYGLVALVQFGDTLLGAPKWVYHGVATGPFVNHNSFAAFLGIGLSVGIGCLFAVLSSAHDRAMNALYCTIVLLCIAVIAVALFATGSRMGVLSGCAGAAVAAAVGMRRLHGPTWLPLLAGAVVCAAALYLGAGDSLLARMFGIDLSLDSRWELYRQVWEAILQRPLFGYGGGSFYWAFAPFAHPPLLPDLEWTKAHSTILQWWFELGLVAGSIPLVLYAGSLLVMWRDALSRESWFLSVAAVGAMVTAGVHSFIDFPLEIPANAYLLIALAGIGASTRLRKERH